MSSARISPPRGPVRWSTFSLALIITMTVNGCTHVAGNYPPVHMRTACTKARVSGEGFQLLAGSSLRLDLVEAELDQLGNQGFSRRDPQIIRSVARRKNIPVLLLADRSGNGYYRFTARLDPGICLSLAPGALEVTVKTRTGTTVVTDRGYLLEDRRIPEGCRPPSHSRLDFGPTEGETPTEMDFLVRLPVRGEIVDLAIVPRKCKIILK